MRKILQQKCRRQLFLAMLCQLLSAVSATGLGLAFHFQHKGWAVTSLGVLLVTLPRNPNLWQSFWVKKREMNSLPDPWPDIAVIPF